MRLLSISKCLEPGKCCSKTACSLSEEKIKEFYDLAKSLEIDCLIEVHNEKELKKEVKEKIQQDHEEFEQE